jgi:hypothetical protein
MLYPVELRALIISIFKTPQNVQNQAPAIAGAAGRGLCLKAKNDASPRRYPAGGVFIIHAKIFCYQKKRRRLRGSMMNASRLATVLMTALIFLIGSLGCSTPPPTIPTDPDAEVSYDGLHKIENSRADAAWAVPDLDFSGYTKIRFVSLGIEYREVAKKGSSSVARSQGGPFFIDDKARAQFEDLVDEIFSEELGKITRFQIVDESGPDTLEVGGGLLNVTSQVPPDPVGGRSVHLLTYVGDATLVLEIRDSESNRILARAVDRRAAESIGGSFRRSNTVSGSVEVKRLIRYWAVELREVLEGFNP